MADERLALKNTELHRPVVIARAARAENDAEVLASWVASLESDHSRRNFDTIARRFLAGLPMGLRAATVEDEGRTRGDHRQHQVRGPRSAVRAACQIAAELRPACWLPLGPITMYVHRNLQKEFLETPAIAPIPSPSSVAWGVDLSRKACFELARSCLGLIEQAHAR